MYSPTLSIPVRISTAPEPGNWSPVLDKTTTAGASYSGPAQVARFTFSVLPEQLSFVNGWLVNNIVSEMVKAAETQGVKALRIRLWRDTGPTLSTPYLGELTLSNPASLAQNAMLAVPQVVILAIIGVALAAIFVWLVVKPILSSVSDTVWRISEAAGSLGGLAILALIAIIVLSSAKGK